MVEIGKIFGKSLPFIRRPVRQVEDEALADYIFNKRSCPGWLYRDLGAVASSTSARHRVIVLGCDEVQGSDYAKAVPGARERAAIMFLRDGENIWSVQFAERNLPGQSKPLFDPATAPALVARLAVQACAASDTSAECSSATTISKVPRAVEKK